MSGRRALRLILAALLMFTAGWASFAGDARAHTVDVVSAQITPSGKTFEMTVLLDGARSPGVDSNFNGLVSQPELDAAIEGVFEKLKSSLVLQAPKPPSRMTLKLYEVIGDGHVIRLTLDGAFDSAPENLTATSHMSVLMGMPTPLFMTVTSVGRTVVLQENQSASFAAPPSALEAFGSFLRLGVEHIFTGYDHLAFLMCLLIGARSRKSLIWTVTAFTLAHSVTLSAATLNIVHLPERLVEIIIAATIVYIAVENLTERRLLHRPWITAAFGLVHGFGFAGALQEIGIPKGQVVVTLLAFNLGVETGQLAFLGIVALLLGKYLTSPRLRIAVSAGAACVAVFWVLQRAGFLPWA